MAHVGDEDVTLKQGKPNMISFLRISLVSTIGIDISPNNSLLAPPQQTKQESSTG